jgi:hypothetical protein
VPKEILYIESNPGDLLLMEEAFRELKVDAELRHLGSNEAALRYLEMRYTRGGIPPPHCIVMSINPHDPNPTAVLQFIARTGVLNKIKIFVLGHPNEIMSENETLMHLLHSGLIDMRERLSSWDQQLEFARTITS